MLPPLPVGVGEEAIVCPVGGLVVGYHVAVGDAVNVGDALAIVSSMKMETTVTATVSGVCVAVQSLESNDTIGSGDVIAVIDTEARGGVRQSTAERPESETWDCASATALHPTVQPMLLADVALPIAPAVLASSCSWGYP